MFFLEETLYVGWLKRDLAKKLKEREKTVKLDTKIVTNIQEGKEYIVEKVSEVEIRSGNKTFDALEVILKPMDKNDDKSYSATLWLTDTASSTSKLGSFITAFDSNDTDTWLEKVIKVVKWQDKNREIEVLS